MTLRLVATDMDGTLLQPDLSISPRTRDAIAAAADAGVVVVAATGRGFRSATPLLEVVPEIRTAVCSNGAVIRDLVHGVTTDTRTIAVADLVEVVAAIDELRVGTGLDREIGDASETRVEREISVEREIGVAWEFESGDFGFDSGWVRVRPIVGDEFPERHRDTIPTDAPLVKLIVSARDLSETELVDRLGRRAPSTVEVTYSGINSAEVTGHGVHKAAALQVLCDRLGIAADDVATFGDNGNDVEMLRWAGTGVAMGNARPEVRAVADRIAPAHDADGLAVVLEDLLA